MAVEAIIAVVIQEITNLLTEESQIYGKAKVEVDNVMSRLGEIQKILNRAEHQEQSNMTLMDWMVKFMDKVYRVEDAIESFAAENRLKRLGFVKKPVLELKLCRQVPDVIEYSGDARRFKKEMEGFLKEITECKDEIASLAVASLTASSDAMGQRYQPRQGSDAYYGPKIREETIFKKDVETLVEQLTNNTGPLQIISIFGEAGIGKAEHVKAIYKRTAERDRPNFQKKNALVFLKPKCSFKDLMKVILQKLFINTKTSLKGVEKLDDEGLITKLHRFLEGEKYLIFITDIMSLDHLNKLRTALPNSENGSRVLFTTPDEKCALFEYVSSRYHFKPVDMEYGLMFFMKKVWGQRSSSFSDKFMEELNKKIEEICRGTPLRIAMLAGLLSTRNETKNEWRRVFKELDDATKSPSFHIFTFCYDDLPLHLKPCFLYLGLFEKDYEIPVRRLFGLWLAEGFVKPEGDTVPEDMVEGYLEELVRRNMVEITKRRSDESPRKCRMIHTLHDIFSPMAVKIGLFHLHKKLEENSNAAGEPGLGIRRVVEYTNINTNTTINVNQNLRSYISFNGRKKDMPAEEVKTFIDKIIGTRGFGLLKVLDLEGVYRPRLKENLGKLFHLRYLGLRWTFLDTLPSSLGALLHLQTLDIKHTHITTLPPFIWNMKYLRHLYLNGDRLDIPVLSMKHKYPNQLHTLQGLFVDERLARKIGSTLQRFTNIRKLDLTRQSSSTVTTTTTTSTTTTITTTTSHSSSYEEIGSWIQSLSSLQSLRLRSRDKLGRPSELIIKPFSSLKILSRLYLLGHLHKPLAWYEFPPGLTVLTLSVSLLDKDPMPTLSQLEKLMVLRLLAASYVGEEMHCPRKGFPSLQVLKLWKLENLKRLTVHEGTMQNLHTLDIRCCRQLMKLPVTLLEIKRFDQLILTDMPESFVSAIRENKKNEHTYTIVEKEKDI